MPTRSLAETIGDEPIYRSWIRSYFANKGSYTSTLRDAEKDEKGVYEMYYDFQHPINKMVSHRILATNRGEKEDVLKVALVVDESKSLIILNGNSLSTPIHQQPICS